MKNLLYLEIDMTYFFIFWDNHTLNISWKLFIQFIPVELNFKNITTCRLLLNITYHFHQQQRTLAQLPALGMLLLPPGGGCLLRGPPLIGAGDWGSCNTMWAYPWVFCTALCHRKVVFFSLIWEWVKKVLTGGGGVLWIILLTVEGLRPIISFTMGL